MWSRIPGFVAEENKENRFFKWHSTVKIAICFTFTGSQISIIAPAPTTFQYKCAHIAHKCDDHSFTDIVMHKSHRVIISGKLLFIVNETMEIFTKRVKL